MRSSSLLLLLALLGLSLTSMAASVSQVKGNKLLIQLEGMQVAPGNEMYVLNESGKKIGLVQVKQVKGDKALAEITKGKAVAGAPMQMKMTGAGSSANAAASSKPSRTAETSGSKSSSFFGGKGKNVGGILAGYSMDEMSLTVQNGSGPKEDVSMKDTGYSLKAFYDYPVSPAFTIRLASGLEMFNATGTTSAAICDNGSSKTCQIAFNYLAFEGNAHYNITEGSFKTWVGLGYSFLVAASKKNNIPNLSSDSSTNQMILISGGVDWWTSKNSFYPIAIEYGTFPGSSNVKADGIFLRGGYGFTF